MPKQEQIIYTPSPRQDAIKYVTNEGKHTLIVQNFLDAARPSGKDATPVYIDQVDTACFLLSTTDLFIYLPISLMYHYLPPLFLHISFGVL
jgi:hypothetical protein